MNLKTYKWIIVTVSSAILALVFVQLYWIRNAFALQEKTFDASVKEAMESTCKQVNERLGCFEFVSKAYVKPGEGLYVIKQEWEKDSSGTRYFLDPEKNPLDSLMLMGHFYGDTVLYKQRSTKLTFPVTAEISIKMTYVENDSLVFNNPDTSFYDFASANMANYRRKLAGAQPLKEKLDFGLLDSLLKRELNQRGITSAEYAVYDQDLDTVLLSKAATSVIPATMDYNVPLVQDEMFNHKYRLLLSVPGKSNILIRSSIGLLVVSTLVILLLIFSFLYFVRSILKQKRISEIKEDFVNNMTHEFKTPIANIALAVDTLREQSWLKNDRAERIVDIVARENERMHENVKRVLDVSVANREGIRIEKRPLHLHHIIETVVTNFELQAIQAGARITLNLKAGNDLIAGDETHLVNMVYNLLDNALKFRGGDDPLIEISTFSQNGKLLVQVKDNGIGINSREHELIFERFYRVPQGNIHNVKGFGLGLSYVKSIMEAHGGKVRVESAPGSGSCFAVEFSVT